jgi:hypothetical protein
MAATELLARPFRKDLAAAHGGGVFLEATAFPDKPAAGYLNRFPTVGRLGASPEIVRETQTKRLGTPLALMSQPRTQAERT